MRDVKIGFLHQMEFLSKSFFTLAGRVEAYRKTEKVENSGTCTSAISARCTVA